MTFRRRDRWSHTYLHSGCSVVVTHSVRVREHVGSIPAIPTTWAPSQLVTASALQADMQGSIPWGPTAVTEARLPQLVEGADLSPAKSRFESESAHYGAVVQLVRTPVS